MRIEEEWRIIARNSNYEVSNLGRARRATPNKYGRDKGRLLTPVTNTHGYLFVGLCENGKNTSTNIHSLVCEAFHGPKPSPSHEVAHGDGDQTNNRADNLRWATRKENFEDRDRHGRTARGDKHPSRARPGYLPCGEHHHASKLTERDVIAIRAAPRGQTVGLAAQYRISQTQVSDIRTGKSWKHVEQPASLAAA